MQLSKKKAFFSLFFSTFEVDKTEHFQKKNDPHSWYSSDIMKNISEKNC